MDKLDTMCMIFTGYRWKKNIFKLVIIHTQRYSFFWVLFFIFLAQSAVAGEPSFDCTKARASVELTICSNNILAKQDLNLAEAYKIARSFNKTISKQQIIWIKNREKRCGTDISCIAEETAQRIEILSRGKNDKNSIIGKNFDCHILNNSFYGLVCDINDLSQLINDLEESFSLYFRASGKDNVIINDQKNWEHSVYKICNNFSNKKSCLINKINSRITDLVQWYVQAGGSEALISRDNSLKPPIRTTHTCTISWSDWDTFEYWNELSRLIRENHKDFSNFEQFNTYLDARFCYKKSNVYVKEYVGYSPERKSYAFYVERDGESEKYRIKITDNGASITTPKYVWIFNKNSENFSRWNYNPDDSCSRSDICFALIEKRNNGATIQCTKGIDRGNEECISFNGKKWSSGCGISDTFSHHYNFERAANIACGQW